MSKNPSPPRLHDLPLWRLLVALADAERAFGPTDPITRRLAAAVKERLVESDALCNATAKGGSR